MCVYKEACMSIMSLNDQFVKLNATTKSFFTEVDIVKFETIVLLYEVVKSKATFFSCRK